MNPWIWAQYALVLLVVVACLCAAVAVVVTTFRELRESAAKYRHQRRQQLPRE